MKKFSDTEVIVAVATVTILFFLISVFLVLYFLISRRNKKMYQAEIDQSKKEFEKQLLQVQVEVQESTYRHIAKELHDNVGQLLSTTKMLIGVMELKLGQVPEALHTASATLSQAIQEIRLLSRSLDQEWLQQFDFLDNLQAEVARLNAGETIKAVVQCYASITMKVEEQIILFRIVQEAIQNAVRHAHPTMITIAIKELGNCLEVKVKNDGNPLPPHFKGMGTANMRHRAHLFGGTVAWKSQGYGTIVTICLPLNQAA